MYTKPNVKELLDYLDSSLPKDRRLEIDSILLSQTHYLRILKGVEILLNKLENKEAVILYLEKQKETIEAKITHSIYNDTNKKD